MFLSKQAQAPQAMMNTDAGYVNASQPPQEYGVSSALKDVISQVDRTCTLSANLQDTLGISVPNEKAALGVSASPLFFKARTEQWKS